VRSGILFVAGLLTATLGLGGVPPAVADGGRPQGPASSLEGTLTSVHGDDFTAGRAVGRTYALDTGQETLRLDGKVPAKFLGAHVRVRGTRKSDRFMVAEGDVQKTGSQPSTAAAVAGAKRVAVILFNFTNNASQPYTAAFANGVMFSDGNSVANYFSEESWGQLTMTGAVYGWYTIAYASGNCDTYKNDWATAANNAAAADGFDASNFTNVVYAFPGISCDWSGFGQIPGTRTWINGALYLYKAAHELGHNFGLWHSSSLSCLDGTKRVTFSNNCTHDEYGDSFDIMGSAGTRHTHNQNLWELGWIPSGDVQTITTSGTYLLAPVEIQTGTPKALRIKRSGTDRCGAFTNCSHFYLEFRQPYGTYFDNFGPLDPAVNGVTIRMAPEPSIPTNSMLLDMTPTTPSFADAPLTVGRSFFDAVDDLTITTTAVSSSGATIRVDFENLDPEPPSTPGNLSATATGAGTARLTWSASTDNVGVTGYKVFRDGVVVAQTAALSYNDSGLSAQTTYTYSLIAFDDAGNTSPPAIAMVTTPSIPFPGAPQNLTAQALVRERGRIDLNWDAPDDGGGEIRSYRIYRSLSSNQETYYAQVNVATQPCNCFNDTPLEDGTTYYYQVRAVNPAGEGPASEEVFATTPVFSLPSEPLNLAAEAGLREITLTWDAPASDGGAQLNSYHIYRGTSTGTETRIGEVCACYQRFIDDRASGHGTTYYYRVSASNEIGEGPLSVEVSVTTFSAPTAPRNPAARSGPGAGQIILSWEAPANDGGSPVTDYWVRASSTAQVNDSTPVVARLDADARSFTESDLLDGATRYYRVQALNQVGNAMSAEVSATTFALPSEPKNINAQAGPGAGQITLSWDAPESGEQISNYRIYRGLTSGTATFFTDAGSVTHFEDSGLLAGTAYYYVVSAVNPVGEGSKSNEANATTFTLPGAPKTLVAQTGPDPGVITISWTAPSEDGGMPITAYEIYSGSVSGGETLLATVDANTTSFTNEGLPSDAKRYYTVAAVNGVGEGPASNEASAATFAFPGAPENLAAQAGPAPGEISISWAPPSSDGGRAIVAYEVYRASVPGAETPLTMVDANTLSFTDESLPSGARRYYTVTALNAVGEGPASNEASATTFASPSAPQNLTAGFDLFTLGGVRLEWEKPVSDGGLSLDGYRIYRGTSSGSRVFLAQIGDILSYTDTTCPLGAICYYTVTAINRAGESPSSNEDLMIGWAIPTP
jgi:fibronectin type 3 domain-containing protein